MQMRRARVENRLWQVGDRLRAARAELAVVDEQLRAIAEEADDARVRSLVAESPLADREMRDTGRQVEAMRRSREATVAELARLERLQEELIQRLAGGAD
ncbi:MAG: hypothetical protein ACRDYD_01700 [Acidimicrobiales bacterium]